MGSLKLLFNKNGSRMFQKVECIMCSKSVKIKLIANHLENVHKIEENLQNFCRLQLKGQKKLKKALKKKERKDSCEKKYKGKRQSEKDKLLGKFEKCLQNQYLDIDVFNKMLMNVSMKYHKGRIKNEPIEYDDAMKTQDVKHSDKNLKLTINLKDKKIVSKPNQEEIKEGKENNTFQDRTNLKKKSALKHPKFTTSTPKPGPKKIKANSNVTSRTKGS